MKAKHLLILLACGLPLACSQPDIFSEFHPFPNAEWDKREAIRFIVPIHDTSSPLNLSLELRNDNRYPYRNLWLFIDHRTPDGRTSTDTLGVELADAYGKWHGRGMSVFANSIPYQTNVLYADTGNHTYTLRQGMRADILKGITDIGLRITHE
jgi:gliding motility-associated lipoprotein GldH